MPYVLLTGATGLLGRYLLRDLLLAGQNVAVVVRPVRGESAAQRIETIMTRWENEVERSLPRPVILTGDLNEPNLGFDSQTLAWVGGNCESILHSAASLTFHADSADGEPWRSNIHGTRNVLAMCRATGIRQFHHVSTAYVCGLRQGTILESELNLGQTPGNDYESSKLTSEQEVRNWAGLDCVTVYRPSIIVGDSQTGYTNTYHGFYAPLRLVYSLLGGMSVDEIVSVDYLGMLGLEGHERKNLVPVEWVSAAMSHLLCHDGHHGGTYHLTTPTPVTVTDMRAVFEESLLAHVSTGKHKLAAAFHQDQFEDAFHEQMKVYRSYWRDDPQFDSRATQAAAPHLPCPAVDRPLLRKLADYAIEANFGWPRERSVPVQHDVAGALAPFEAATRITLGPGQQFVNLQINGNGGGQWRLAVLGDEPLQASPGLAADAGLTLYMNSTTFDLLCQGRVAPEEALRLGLVAALDTSSDAASLAQLVRNIVAPQRRDLALFAAP